MISTISHVLIPDLFIQMKKGVGHVSDLSAVTKIMLLTRILTLDLGETKAPVPIQGTTWPHMGC